MSSREFDLIIFGGTGFTGFYVMRDLLLSMKADKQYANLKWAIAGRNLTKMSVKLSELSSELDRDLSHIKKIVADVSDPNSLLEMASKATLIVNCVGPYILYGRAVVDACVQCSTHHIDISGEPTYIETMVLDYYQEAVKKGLIIISACGWDSIPCDLGVDIAKRRFNGRLHSVETFLRTFPGLHGYSVNFGTLNSLIYGYRNMGQLRNIRRRLYTEVFKKKLPKSRNELKRINLPFTRPEVEGYNVEFPGSDRSVVQRSQYYNYEHRNEPPLQIQTYFSIASFGSLIGMAMFGLLFLALTATEWGSQLLRRYPEFFTANFFSKKGPTRQQIESTRFKTRIIGKGWSREALNDTDPDSEPTTEPDRKIIVDVSGPDPGYIATSACIVQSALTIIYETDKIPRGVLTPASAFRDTNIVERLNSRDLKIEVVSEEKI